MASAKCCALLYQLPGVAPTASSTGATQFRRVRSRSQDALRSVVVPFATRREGSHEVKGNGIMGICVRTNRKWVCFAIAGEGGVEVARR